MKALTHWRVHGDFFHSYGVPKQTTNPIYSVRSNDCQRTIWGHYFLIEVGVNYTYLFTWTLVKLCACHLWKTIRVCIASVHLRSTYESSCSLAVSTIWKWSCCFCVCVCVFCFIAPKRRQNESEPPTAEIQGPRPPTSHSSQRVCSPHTHTRLLRRFSSRLQLPCAKATAIIGVGIADAEPCWGFCFCSLGSLGSQQTVVVSALPLSPPLFDLSMPAFLWVSSERLAISGKGLCCGSSNSVSTSPLPHCRLTQTTSTLFAGGLSHWTWDHGGRGGQGAEGNAMMPHD